MNILDRIIVEKAKEVALRRDAVPVRVLETRPLFGAACYSMSAFLRDPEKSGIIAEFKRRSPSKGDINITAQVAQVTVGYAQAGASALSVLTDTPFFGGSADDLSTARLLNQIPILRKDFTIDEYQIIEAKAMGADAILLIAAALEPATIKAFCDVAHKLHLEVLLEVHNEEELVANLGADADLIGVNNRNLKTFDLNIDVSRRLAAMMPDHVVKVSESGIESVDTIVELKKHGFQGFLMGQNFMQREHPDLACKSFIEDLRKATAATRS